MMKRYLLLCFSAAFGLIAQQPRIDMLQNNYSYLLPDNPSYGIAQGSIFIIKGANLAPASTDLQNVPLSTMLNGVSARVTVDGVTTEVLWYYVTPNQLGGILPSSTPVGNGTITVSTTAGASAPAPIKVVRSAMGILTLDGTGTGTAAAYDSKYTFLGNQNPARPGDYIQLYGTGLGPVTGDERVQQSPTDLTSIPITVDIGGVPARVVYRGRTIYPGLDQINVLIPDGVAPNCAAALTLRIGNYASNPVTIPVASAAGPCPAPPTGGGGTPISQSEIDGWISAGQFRVGSIGLTRQTSYSISDNVTGGPPTTSVTRSDVLSAGFNRISGPDLSKLANSQVSPPAPGSCTFYDGPIANPYPNLSFTSLDAGSPLTVNGPAGTRTAQRSRNSVGSIEYSATIGTGDAGNYIDAGRYTFTGPGGPDVGAFSGTIEVAPELIWTNRTSLLTVDRSQPLTLTWSGGEPSTLITIQGVSTATQGTAVSATSFQCFARNTDRQFTVPVSILSRMAPSTRINAGAASILLRGTLGIASVGVGTRMTASGVDYLTAGNQWGVAQSAEYK